MLPDGVSRKLFVIAHDYEDVECPVESLCCLQSLRSCRAVIGTLALTKALRRIVLQP